MLRLLNKCFLKMGKVRRTRQRYHLQSSKNKKNEDTFTEERTMDINEDALKNIELLDIPGGLFKDIDIDVGKINRRLDNLDKVSIISKKSIKDLNDRLTKKERLKIRRELWLKKIEVTKRAKMKSKTDELTKQKHKDNVVGDLKPLVDALPTFPIEISPVKKKPECAKIKPRLRKSFKQRQKETMQDIKIFKQVLNHPEFKKDPQATISDHLCNMLQRELENNKT